MHYTKFRSFVFLLPYKVFFYLPVNFIKTFLQNLKNSYKAKKLLNLAYMHYTKFRSFVFLLPYKVFFYLPVNFIKTFLQNLKNRLRIYARFIF